MPALIIQLLFPLRIVQLQHFRDNVVALEERICEVVKIKVRLRGANNVVAGKDFRQVQCRLPFARV